MRVRNLEITLSSWESFDSLTALIFQIQIEDLDTLNYFLCTIEMANRLVSNQSDNEFQVITCIFYFLSQYN